MSSLSSFKTLKSSKPKGKSWKTRGQLEEEKKEEAQQPKEKKAKVDGMDLYKSVMEKERELLQSVPSMQEEKKIEAITTTTSADLPPKEEVFKQLRDRNEPCTLFGETDEQRVARLHLVEQSVGTDAMAVDQQISNVECFCIAYSF